MNEWVGRFAPSPSGSLHFGSLVAALGSYLIARQKTGEWLLRIEDLDPPREVSGAANDIIKTLELFGFEWDREIVFQSQRNHLYQQALEQLVEANRLYHCNCSRKLVLHRNGGVYDGFCRNRHFTDNQQSALRIYFDKGFECFNDQIQGDCLFIQAQDVQDFVVKRRDNLFAYQLAVVVDDIEQGVNHVVRGADILDSTPKQNFLYHCFNHKPPIYFHLPLVVDNNQQKLSKSQLSPAIKPYQASQYLVNALRHLGQEVSEELTTLKPAKILQWAITHWQLNRVGCQPKVYVDKSTHSTD